MFKSKQFKELIGFDHTILVISYILLTGLSFPFIFSMVSGAQYHEHIVGEMLGGIFYASVLTFGNIYIFHRNKTAKKEFKNAVNLRYFLRNIAYHFIFTVLASLSMTVLQKACMGLEIWDAELIRSIIGSVLLSAIYIGFYEALYFINALGRSIKEQEQLKRENVVSQLEQLKNQVKPHFLFNSLNTLMSIIPEDADLALDYVQNLSKAYRYILEIKDRKLVSLQEELECIRAYIFLLEIRFGENLLVEIDETGFLENHHLPPLSLQLLVENAVKHNIISAKKPLKIKIHKNEMDQLIVSNNLQEKQQTMPSTGTGLSNIKNRYEILSNQSIEINKTKDNFSVAIPLIKVLDRKNL